jgi:hypothetical protein
MTGLGSRHWFCGNADEETGHDRHPLRCAHLACRIDISGHRHAVLTGILGKTHRGRLTVRNTLDDPKRPATTVARWPIIAAGPGAT